MPRYVILHHQTPPEYERPTHYDLMLEVAGRLRTWSLPALPDAAPSQEVLALADHRIDYLEIEGPLLGNRGSVTQWDTGAYEIVAGDVANQDDRLVVRLRGERMSCRVELVPLPDDEQENEASPQRWRLSVLAD